MAPKFKRGASRPSSLAPAGNDGSAASQPSTAASASVRKKSWSRPSLAAPSADAPTEGNASVAAERKKSWKRPSSSVPPASAAVEGSASKSNVTDPGRKSWQRPSSTAESLASKPDVADGPRKSWKRPSSLAPSPGAAAQSSASKSTDGPRKSWNRPSSSAPATEPPSQSNASTASERKKSWKRQSGISPPVEALAETQSSAPDEQKKSVGMASKAARSSNALAEGSPMPAKAHQAAMTPDYKGTASWAKVKAISEIIELAEAAKQIAHKLEIPHICLNGGEIESADEVMSAAQPRTPASAVSQITLASPGPPWQISEAMSPTLDSDLKLELSPESAWHKSDLKAELQKVKDELAEERKRATNVDLSGAQSLKDIKERLLESSGKLFNLSTGSYLGCADKAAGSRVGALKDTVRQAALKEHLRQAEEQLAGLQATCKFEGVEPSDELYKKVAGLFKKQGLSRARIKQVIRPEMPSRYVQEYQANKAGKGEKELWLCTAGVSPKMILESPSGLDYRCSAVGRLGRGLYGVVHAVYADCFYAFKTRRQEKQLLLFRGITGTSYDYSTASCGTVQHPSSPPSSRARSGCENSPGTSAFPLVPDLRKSGSLSGRERSQTESGTQELRRSGAREFRDSLHTSGTPELAPESGLPDLRNCRTSKSSPDPENAKILGKSGGHEKAFSHKVSLAGHDSAFADDLCRACAEIDLGGNMQELCKCSFTQRYQPEAYNRSVECRRSLARRRLSSPVYCLFPPCEEDAPEGLAQDVQQTTTDQLIDAQRLRPYVLALPIALVEYSNPETIDEPDWNTWYDKGATLKMSLLKDIKEEQDFQMRLQNNILQQKDHWQFELEEAEAVRARAARDLDECMEASAHADALKNAAKDWDVALKLFEMENHIEQEHSESKSANSLGKWEHQSRDFTEELATLRLATLEERAQEAEFLAGIREAKLASELAAAEAKCKTQSSEFTAELQAQSQKVDNLLSEMGHAELASSTTKLAYEVQKQKHLSEQRIWQGGGTAYMSAWWSAAVLQNWARLVFLLESRAAHHVYTSSMHAAATTLAARRITAERREETHRRHALAAHQFIHEDWQMRLASLTMGSWKRSQALEDWRHEIAEESRAHLVASKALLLTPALKDLEMQSLDNEDTVDAAEP